jgi:hypothetical protein
LAATSRRAAPALSEFVSKIGAVAKKAEFPPPEDEEAPDGGRPSISRYLRGLCKIGYFLDNGFASKCAIIRIMRHFTDSRECRP